MVSQISLIVIHFCKLICMETELGRALELRTDFSAAELRKLARRCGHHRQSCRLLSIAAIYDGMNRVIFTHTGNPIYKAFTEQSAGQRVHHIIQSIMGTDAVFKR